MKLNRILCIVSVIMVILTGCFHNPVASNSSGEYYYLFKLVWEDYEANYPEFTVKGVNWREVFYTYSPLAEQAESTDDLVHDVLHPMLSELHDGHIWFYRPDGTILRTYLPDIELNFSQNVLMTNYLLPNGFTGYTDNVGYCHPESLPYISIDSWTLDINMNTITTFFELAEGFPAVIFDVRMNSGGNNTLTDNVAGLFTDTPTPGWYSRFRTGPGYDDVRYIVERSEPSGQPVYDGTIYLLIGDYVASSNEDFTLLMKAFDNVVLVGDTTMGAVCCPRTIDLADGWKVNTITWSARTLDKEPVEDVGIAPDIYVPAAPEDFAQGVDPVLEYAIELLETL